MLVEEIKKFSVQITSTFYFDYDLKKSNWFNIGGKTKVFFKPESLSDLILFLKKFGTKDTYVLTARPPASAGPIQQFLAAQGLNIPLENITGLGNSTGEAKANWFIELFENLFCKKSKNNKLTQVESFLRQELDQKEHNLTHKRDDLKIRIHEDKMKRLLSEQSSFESALRGQTDSTVCS